MSGERKAMMSLDAAWEKLREGLQIVFGECPIPMCVFGPLNDNVGWVLGWELSEPMWVDVLRALR